MDIYFMSNFKKFNKSFLKKKTHKNENIYFISINGNKINKWNLCGFSLSSFFYKIYFLKLF